jgi:F0F1-type ATP synthase assembly protein I
MAFTHIWGYLMEEASVLQKQIEQLEHNHKSFVEIGAMIFIGILATGMIIDHTHNYSLWFLILLLSIALIATIVIAVKQDMQKDRYCEELGQLQAIASQESV